MATSPLANLLSQEREPASTVALRWNSGSNDDQSLSWGDFVVDVARLRERIGVGSDGGWVLLTEDAYSFAVGLFALWHSGRHAISPPNQQIGALRRPQTGAAGVLTDRPDWFPEGSTIDPLSRAVGEDIREEFKVVAKSFKTLDDQALAVEFFTSGTTGDEKPVMKELRHLSREVAELRENWNDCVGDAVFFSSASHQHIYGMLFGVLWPLCSGHVFRSEHFLHAGELVPRLKGVDRSVLASVPTHLKRLAQHTQSPQLRDSSCQVFSSGGPLPEETAHRIESLLGGAPIEIFGSTETGGIAWRRQSPRLEDGVSAAELRTPWKSFPSVEISEDPDSGTLRVRSPFVTSGAMTSEGIGSFTTGDRIDIRATGLFDLLGRTDRVVKIGERRLDLTRMESELRGERWVEEVALTTLRRDGDEMEGDHADSQERVVAVVVPSEEGWTLIRDSGRRGLSGVLRNGLAEAWDPVLHPRYWRYALAIPENSQGKITQDLLRGLFREADWGSLATDHPEILGETRFDQCIERTVLIPSDLSCFPGHFPDRFVVPGVLQLGWVLALAEVMLGRRAEIQQIDSMKMLKPIDPGYRVRIRVEETSPTRLDFELSFASDVFSKGRIRIVAPTE